MAMTAVERERAAEEAVRQLRAELTGAGVVLPSLKVDATSLASSEPRPLLDLGRCNLDTALRLVAALKGAR
ncbi:hypothetical protein [Streptomyces sp. N35]|uniref:hypothetical protein n=1 Tax=Streptomyces sp. N35 TaxID=2795730 RepID=UPI0018F46CB0|nr:hypothetical protein [Streptomyces sp. N35]